MDKPVNKKPKLKKQEILPKRVGGIYEKIYEYENIKTAIKAVCSSPNATKSKKNEKTNAKQQKEKYLGDIDKYTKMIQELLIEGRYKPRKLRRKEIYDGVRHKKRVIAKPCMVDKIVQRAVLQIIEPILMRRMYMYSCASIKGKGGIYCKRKIERAIARKNRKGKKYKNVKHTKYWEALDIRKCYDNILHCFLKFRLIKMFKDKRLLELLFMCIDVYWVKETAAGKRGIPIGTPFGHWFANIMLTPVDFVIKHIFKIKYYFRYMDDMLLFSSNKKKLRQFVACIRDALSRIGLHIKSKLQVHATNDKGKLGNRPIDFIGYRFYRDCTTLRSSICLRITRRIRKVRKKQILNGHDARSVISYYGWIKNTDSWGLKVKYFDDTVKSAKEKISNGSGKNQRRRRDRRGSTDRGGYRWETGGACARTA